MFATMHDNKFYKPPANDRKLSYLKGVQLLARRECRDKVLPREEGPRYHPQEGVPSRQAFIYWCCGDGAGCGIS